MTNDTPTTASPTNNIHPLIRAHWRQQGFHIELIYGAGHIWVDVIYDSDNPFDRAINIAHSDCDGKWHHNGLQYGGSKDTLTDAEVLKLLNMKAFW